MREERLTVASFSTGMRRAELIGLGRYDLDVERGTVMVRQGKGRTARSS